MFIAQIAIMAIVGTIVLNEITNKILIGCWLMSQYFSLMGKPFFSLFWSEINAIREKRRKNRNFLNHSKDEEEMKYVCVRVYVQVKNVKMRL